MQTRPVNAFDLQGLAALKRDAKAQDAAALKEAAKQFESLFTKMLLQNMREANKSFGGDSLFGSDQADFYQQMFDDQMAVHLSQGKGLGLADMLIRQLAQTSAARLEAGGGRREAESSNAVAPDLRQTSSSGPQPPAPSPQPLAGSREDFIRSLYPYAQSAAAKLGVDPDALIAQAALETGWGKSMPCTSDGTCSFNLFGVKASASWTGATANVSTLEFEDGVAVRKVERFRAYSSPAESFMDYARLIGGAARYADARGAGGDIAGFAQALQRGGYATDPNYAAKLTAVAAEVRALQGAQGDAA